MLTKRRLVLSSTTEFVLQSITEWLVTERSLPNAICRIIFGIRLFVGESFLFFIIQLPCWKRLFRILANQLDCCFKLAVWQVKTFKLATTPKSDLDELIVLLMSPAGGLLGPMPDDGLMW